MAPLQERSSSAMLTIHQSRDRENWLSIRIEYTFARQSQRLANTVPETDPLSLNPACSCRRHG